MVRLDSLKTNPRNPRVIKDKKFQQLVNSLKEFPRMMELRPIVIDEARMILGGNMRRKALEALGYVEIPDEWVKNAADLTEAQKLEFIIKDNVQFGEWDFDLLKGEEWNTTDLRDWGLELEEEDETIHLKDDGFEMPLTVSTDILPGDYFEIGDHRLLCADSTTLEAWNFLTDGLTLDLNHTDPPYNVAYVGKTADALTIINDKQTSAAFYDFLKRYFTASQTFTKPGGAYYVFFNDCETRNFVNAFEDSGLLLKQMRIWLKNSMVLGRRDYQFIHEPILYGWKPGAAHYFTPDRTKTTVHEDDLPNFKELKKDQLIALLEEIYSERTKKSVIKHDRPSRSFDHPTMKPILLVGEMIANSSQKGEIVGDGFGGSGTTMVASEMLGRRAFLMDDDPRYCQVIIDRMRQLNPSITITKNPRRYEPKAAK